MKALTEHPHYEILERWGQGGMGVVYRARDRRLNCTVALKFIIDAEDAGESTNALQRFRREAEATAALNHPAIATIFEAGEWDGEPFLALEFLPGGMLREISRGCRLTFSEILYYATQLSSGLAFAIPRESYTATSSRNCMFSEHGDLKLVDFGLAKPIDAQTITQPGSAVGTIAYMAPEVLRGEPASTRSDLYSLGSVVYEIAEARFIIAITSAFLLLRASVGSLRAGLLWLLSPVRQPWRLSWPWAPPSVSWHASSRGSLPARRPAETRGGVGTPKCATRCVLLTFSPPVLPGMLTKPRIVWASQPVVFR